MSMQELKNIREAKKTYTAQGLRTIFRAALDQLCNEDKLLLQHKVGEQCLCGRLALYLTPRFPDYYTDLEYNRKQDGKFKTCEQREGRWRQHLRVERARKRADEGKPPLFRDEPEIRITTDLIVHNRRLGLPEEQNNLLAIEMKKRISGWRAEAQREDDELRLEALTRQDFTIFYPKPKKGANDPIGPEHVCGYVLGAFIVWDEAAQQFAVKYFENGRAMNEETVPYTLDLTARG